MKLFKRSIELVVIRDIFNPPILDDNGKPVLETYQGQDLEKLLKQAFGGKGLSDSVRLYHNDLSKDITPKTLDDVDKIMRLNGRIYAVVKPMGIGAFIATVVVSTLVSVAMAFLMPVPVAANQSANAPPSPNNALAARTNQQRLGGRIPDIFGTVWSVPDLIAVTYNVYVDSKEIEYSYYCIGRGRFNVQEAYDDTTPISQVESASVLVFDPDKNLTNTPTFTFGGALDIAGTALAGLTAKKYSTVNGQTLIPSNSFHRGITAQFKAPNKIISTYIASRWGAGATLNIEGASSVNSIPTEGQPVNTYSLSGIYEVQSVSGNEITLLNPSTINADWARLATNGDITEIIEVTASSGIDKYWQGWFYTSDVQHTSAYLSVVAANGIYITDRLGVPRALRVAVTIESDVVNADGTTVPNTRHIQTDYVSSPLYISDAVSYATEASYYQITSNSIGGASREYIDEQATTTAAKTIVINNPNAVVGKRLRVRISRGARLVNPDGQLVQEVKVKDFYSYRKMTASDMPKGVTTVYTKTLATEGALSLKERKLRLLVQRYVTDATTGILKLSNRADDIIRHIATDPKIGNLQLSQIDVAQIKSEIDAQIAYFGTDKCSEFCGTFDDNNLSAEETLQTVGKAVFSQAKRQGNKIMLDFERIVPGSVAVFNSHNIIPDTFTASQSLGVPNDYDGVTVEYTDPADDATVTLSYPNDSVINPHEDKLIGVRNEVQAHMHMMRLYNKDRHAYKTCEFTAGDESNIVVRTNRITVADQLRANVQQGSVDSIETVGSDIVLYTTDPVSIEPSTPHTLFIQTINNGVEAIEVTARDDYSVKLARLPSGEISTGYDKVVQATYQIVTEEDKDRDAYLVSQKDPSEAMTNKLICTNYDDRYYQNDSDHINGLIT